MTDAEIQAAIQAGITAAKADTTLAQTWLQKHERLILVVLFLVGAVFLTNHLLNNWSAKDQAQAQAAVQQLNDQKANNAQTAAQIKALSDQYQATIAQLAQQNAQLAAAVSNRTIVLQQQQATDKTLPMPELGNRWAKLAGVDPADMTASTAGITVTPNGALATTVALEKLPVLEQNLADETSIAKNTSEQLDVSKNLISGLGTQVTGLQTEIKDQDVACKAQITAVKAEARKGKWKAFWYGVGTGVAIVTGIVVAVH